MILPVLPYHSQIRFSKDAPTHYIGEYNPAIQVDHVDTISDIHLIRDFRAYTTPEAHAQAFEKQHTFKVAAYLKALVNMHQFHQQDQTDTLVINGDGLDILNSWVTPHLPGGKNPFSLSEIQAVCHQIIQDNQPVFDQLRAFLQLRHTQFIFNKGNHDNILFAPGHEPVQRAIRKALGVSEDDEGKVQFRYDYTRKDLKLHIEHGNRGESFCDAADNHQFAPGDAATQHIMGTLIEKTRQDLMQYGYTDAQDSKGNPIKDFKLFNEVVGVLENIERIRPFNVIPEFLEVYLNDLRKRPENAGKEKRLDKIILDAFHQAIDSPAFDFLLISAGKTVYNLIIGNRIGKPLTLPSQRDQPQLPPGWHRMLVSKLTHWVAHPNKILRQLILVLGRGHSNQRQMDLLAAEHARLRPDTKIYVTGHTHLPTHKALWKIDQQQRTAPLFVNLGTWCNAFKLGPTLKKVKALMNRTFQQRPAALDANIILEPFFQCNALRISRNRATGIIDVVLHQFIKGKIQAETLKTVHEPTLNEVAENWLAYK